MIVLSIVKGKSTQSFVLKERLTMKLAKWVADGLVLPKHQLGSVLPSSRFKSFAINHLGNKWVISFSRKANPTYITLRGYKIDILEADKAHIEIHLESVAYLDLKDLS